MIKKLKVALLGCGRASHYIHLAALTGLPNVELTALAESDPERCSEAAKRAPRAETFSDFRELLERADVEAAVITLPNRLHVPAAVAAFRRGLHVYVEKPLALSLAESDEVMTAWRASGSVGMIGHNYRFSPMHEKARRLIGEGRIGGIVALQSVFSTVGRDLPQWKRRRETGGGALLDLASHHLDLAGWFIGAVPVAIACSLRSAQNEDDTVVLQLEFEGGTIAQTLASLSTVEDDRFEIYGDSGRIVVDRYRADDVEVHPPTLERVRLRRFTYAARALASPAYWRAKIAKSGPEVSYWRALSSFAEAALQGRSERPDLMDGYRCLALLEAAEQSAREGRRVRVPSI